MTLTRLLHEIDFEKSSLSCNAKDFPFQWEFHYNFYGEDDVGGLFDASAMEKNVFHKLLLGKSFSFNNFSIKITVFFFLFPF